MVGLGIVIFVVFKKQVGDTFSIISKEIFFLFRELNFIFLFFLCAFFLGEKNKNKDRGKLTKKIKKENFCFCTFLIQKNNLIQHIFFFPFNC